MNEQNIGIYELITTLRKQSKEAITENLKKVYLQIFKGNIKSVYVLNNNRPKKYQRVLK